MCFDLDSHPPIAPIAGGALDSARARPDRAPTATGSRRSTPGPPSRPAPAIVILPDVRGLHPYYEELALRFAEHGVDALAIDYFGRTGRASSRGEATSSTCPHVGADDLGRASRPTSRRASAALRAPTRRPAGADRGLHDRLLHGRPDVVPRRDARPRARRRRSGSTARSSGAWRNDAPAPVDVAGSIASPVLGLFGGADDGITRRRGRRVRRGARRPPASTTGSSPTRARRTASSTGRRPSSRTRARPPGPRSWASSGRADPGSAPIVGSHGIGQLQ